MLSEHFVTVVVILVPFLFHLHVQTSPLPQLLHKLVAEPTDQRIHGSRPTGRAQQGTHHCTTRRAVCRPQGRRDGIVAYSTQHYRSACTARDSAVAQHSHTAGFGTGYHTGLPHQPRTPLVTASPCVAPSGPRHGAAAHMMLHISHITQYMCTICHVYALSRHPPSHKAAKT